MTPDWKEQTQCVGKQRFDNSGLAKKVAARQSRKDGRSTIYRCPFCSGWHVGSSNGMQANRRK